MPRWRKKFLGEFMGCLKPIQVYNLKKGEKAKFKRFNCIRLGT
ncbi:hypothetical protein [Spiroplasma endosymbiont of Tipula paludosa]